MQNCSIDSYHLTTSYQAFPIEQQHFWGLQDLMCSNFPGLFRTQAWSGEGNFFTAERTVAGGSGD